MVKRLILCSMLVLATLLASLPVSAQQQSDPLLAMLALVPDTTDSRADTSIVSYVDYRAVESSQGIAKPANSAAYAAMGDAAKKWFRAMMRVTSGPNELVSYFQRYVTDMPKLVGFDWFDIDRALEFGVPPRLGMILGGRFDSAAIGKALSAREFEEMDVDGVPVWYRYEDAQLNLKAREPGDPFGGNLGVAARIAVMPGFIANSRYWDLTKQMVAAHKQTQKSLAEAADYRSLAQAITDPKTYNGMLVQAQFLPVNAVEQAESTARMPNPPDLAQYGELPPYTLAVLADRQEGASQVLLIAVAYPDAETAQRASVELHKRVSGFDIGKMYEEWKVTVDDPHVYTSEGSQYVAVVSLRYPLPPTADAGSKDPAPQAGIVFRRWINALYQRQFYPLALKLPKQ
jgi:hypothetical protein